MPEGGQLRVEMVQSHGGSNNGRDNQQLGRYRFSLTGAKDPSAPNYAFDASLALNLEDGKRSQKQNRALLRAWLKSRETSTNILSQIRELEAGFPEAETSVLHTMEATSEFPRVTRLLCLLYTSPSPRD